MTFKNIPDKGNYWLDRVGHFHEVPPCGHNNFDFQAIPKYRGRANTWIKISCCMTGDYIAQHKLACGTRINKRQKEALIAYVMKNYSKQTLKNLEDEITGNLQDQYSINIVAR